MNSEEKLEQKMFGLINEWNYKFEFIFVFFCYSNARWAILGETAKLVPFSPKRFEVMAVDEDVIRLQVMFGPQETVKLDIYTGTTLWSLTCQRDRAGPLLIEITDINSFNCLIPPAIHW